MLLAILPLLLPFPDLAPAQGLGPSEQPTYEGAHCNFSYSHSLSAREFGTGWGVIAEAYDETASPAQAHAWFRVTSILSDTEPASLAAEILGLERTDLAELGWALHETGEAVTRSIDGAERHGTRYSMSRSTASPAEGVFTLYAWRNETAVILVRTISLDAAEEEIIAGILDSLQAPGIRSDSQRMVGSPEIGVRIPANWQSGEASLGSGYKAYTVATPDGNVEFVLSPMRTQLTVHQERAHMLQTSAARLDQMESQGQVSLLDSRVAWLNVEGTVVSGMIRRLQDSQGNIIELPSFAFVPEGLDRVIQIQASPPPGKESSMLSTLTRMTRMDVYRKEKVELTEEPLNLPGMQLAVPRNLSKVGLSGDSFAGGSGVAFGDANGSGPRWLFWSIPKTSEDAELPEIQSAWMQKWLDRDFPRGEVALRQTMDVDFLIGKSRQGLAWTVNHAPLVENVLGDPVPGKSTRWMCALVAIPLKDRTLLAALRVDDRDKFPMLDDFRSAVARVSQSSTQIQHLESKSVDMNIPADGMWSLLKHTAPQEDQFFLLRPGGFVKICVEHFTQASMPAKRVSSKLATIRKVLMNEGMAPGAELNEFYRSIPGRLGERDVRWERFLYKTKTGKSGLFKGTGWREGENTWVTFLINCHDTTTDFLDEANALAPLGGEHSPFTNAKLTYAGLRLPTGGGIEWLPNDNPTDPVFSLTYLGQEDAPAELEFRVDPGPQVTDEELLLSLLPVKPVWDIVVANAVEDIEREVFGRLLKGKRRRGKGYSGPFLWQDVFVDRQEGMLRILRLNGPSSHYQLAEPVFHDLFAMIQPDGAGLVLKPKATDEVTLQEVGDFRIAIPQGIHRVESKDGQDEFHWSNASKSRVLLLFPLPVGEKWVVTHDEILNMGREKEESATNDSDAQAYSLAVKVDGHILPGIAYSINGVPFSAVVFPMNGKSTLLVAKAESGLDSRELMLTALSELKIGSSNSTDPSAKED